MVGTGKIYKKHDLDQPTTSTVQFQDEQAAEADSEDDSIVLF